MNDLFTQPLPEPLPCPFCGSSNIYPMSISNSYVWCKSCAATGPIVYDGPEAGNEQEAEAIRRWNERIKAKKDSE